MLIIKKEEEKKKPLIYEKVPQTLFFPIHKLARV
jgi:hypothetical protein